MADDDGIVEWARHWIEFRRMRHTFFTDEIFDEFAWDMLLHLYVADADGEPISDEELVNRTAQRMPAGLRWIAHLEKAGEIVLERSSAHGVRVTLATDAKDRMTRLLAASLGGRSQLPPGPSISSA